MLTAVCVYIVSSLVFCVRMCICVHICACVVFAGNYERDFNGLMRAKDRAVGICASVFMCTHACVCVYVCT